MKRLLFTFAVLSFTLVACAPTTPAVEAPATESVVASPEVVVEPQGKMPAPSFESQPYVDEANGFIIDYPVGWVVKEAVIGERGSQVVLLSSAEIEEMAVLPAGATRVALTVNLWDPKNDLDAYVATRKTAWDASGFTVLSEERLTLDLGLDAYLFSLQTTEGLTSLNLITTAGENYLTISGEGDLELVREIMSYLRPINP